MNATCSNCKSRHEHCDRDEDGRPEIESTRCASPGCEVWLCEAGCADLSFNCDGCNDRHCNEHMLQLYGMRLCLDCTVDVMAANPEPDCECALSGDSADARGCELHDPRSPYRLALAILDRQAADGDWRELPAKRAPSIQNVQQKSGLLTA